MRVISGAVGGTPLVAPPTAGTRPTSDLMRGVIFNMLATEGPFTVVADLYAGSGALGIEALSRGAARAFFVEQNAVACKTIRRNLEATRFAQSATVICASLPAALTRLIGPLNLVLLDPPYDASDLVSVINRLADSGLLASDAMVVSEHRGPVILPDVISVLTIWKRRRQGDSGVTMYRSVAPAFGAIG